MKQVMNYNKDNGLLNMIRRTDPMINGEKQTELHSQVNERLWCGNTPALSIDRCLLWSYTEVMKKGKMITEPSPGHSNINRNTPTIKTKALIIIHFILHERGSLANCSKYKSHY